MKTAISLVLILLTVGAARQADFGTPPGRLIEVAGRKLHIHCTGNGSPTVILEAGAKRLCHRLVAGTARHRTHQSSVLLRSGRTRVE